MCCCRFLWSAVVDDDVAEFFYARVMTLGQLLVRLSSQISFAYAMWKSLATFPVIDRVLPGKRHL